MFQLAWIDPDCGLRRGFIQDQVQLIKLINRFVSIEIESYHLSLSQSVPLTPAEALTLKRKSVLASRGQTSNRKSKTSCYDEGLCQHPGHREISDSRVSSTGAAKSTLINTHSMIRLINDIGLKDEIYMKVLKKFHYVVYLFRCVKMLCISSARMYPNKLILS